MSCQFKHECPSASGWCDGPKQDYTKCIEFLVSAAKRPKVLYICDRRACKKCSPQCCRTEDVRHAEHFKLFYGSEGTFFEQEETQGAAESEG